MPDDAVTELDLHQHIADLLAGTITFGEFDEWLAGSTWEDSDVTPGALPLVRSIQLVFAEFSSGHRTWPNVRRYLAEVAEWVHVQVSWNAAPTVATGSTAATRVLMLPARLAEPPAVGMNIQLEAVFA